MATRFLSSSHYSDCVHACFDVRVASSTRRESLEARVRARDRPHLCSLAAKCSFAASPDMNLHDQNDGDVADEAIFHSRRRVLLLLIEPNCHDSHEQSSSDFWLHACAVCLAPAMKCAFVLRVCVEGLGRPREVPRPVSGTTVVRSSKYNTNSRS